MTFAYMSLSNRKLSLPLSTHTMPSVNPKSPFTSSSLASGETRESSEGSNLTTGFSPGDCAFKEHIEARTRKTGSTLDFFNLFLVRADARHLEREWCRINISGPKRCQADLDFVWRALLPVRFEFSSPHTKPDGQECLSYSNPPGKRNMGVG